jgi:transcriptional regulator with XRE-family HTH domain
MKLNRNTAKFISSKDIGQAIKQRRLALCMSQEKLAEQLDVSYQQVQRYENGSSKLNVENIQTLAEALSLPVTFFFNLSNLRPLQSEPPHPYTSDDEQELLTIFRTIKHPSYKHVVLSVSRLAALVPAPR